MSDMNLPEMRYTTIVRYGGVYNPLLYGVWCEKCGSLDSTFTDVSPARGAAIDHEVRCHGTRCSAEIAVRTTVGPQIYRCARFTGHTSAHMTYDATIEWKDGQWQDSSEPTNGKDSST